MNWAFGFMNILVGVILLTETVAARQTRGLAPFNPYRVYVSGETVIMVIGVIALDILWFVLAP